MHLQMLYSPRRRRKSKSSAAHRSWIYVTYRRRDVTARCRANVRTAIHGGSRSRRTVNADCRGSRRQWGGWLRRAAYKVNLRERQD